MNACHDCEPTHNRDVREQGRCACSCHSVRRHVPPVGTRVELVAMPDDPDPVPVGSRGTVVGGFRGEQIWVDWDNGRSLMLIPGIDQWRVLQ